MPDNLRRFIVDEYNVRVAIVDATDVVNELALNANTQHLATIAMGRALVGAALLASHTKLGHRVCVNFKTDGPLGDIYAEADFDGGCRAYIQYPHVEPSEEIRHIGQAVGRGLLLVTNQAPGGKPHISSVDVQTGEIGDDIAYFLQQSQQVQSVVNIGTKVNEVGRVEAAGGMLIELMQDVPIEFIEEIESRCELAPSVTDHLFQGGDVGDLMNHYFAGHRWTELKNHSQIRISCTCSRERMIRSLKLLDPQDYRNEDAKDLLLRCQFCGKHYEIALSELSVSRDD